MTGTIASSAYGGLVMSCGRGTQESSVFLMPSVLCSMREVAGHSGVFDFWDFLELKRRAWPCVCMRHGWYGACLQRLPGLGQRAVPTLETSSERRSLVLKSQRDARERLWPKFVGMIVWGVGLVDMCKAALAATVSGLILSP